jgi:hypothetical protein
VPDIPEHVQAHVAEHLHGNWPHLFCDGLEDKVAEVMLAVAGPLLAAAVADKIEEHAATVNPPPCRGDPGNRLRYRNHYASAARVARAAFVAPGELLEDASLSGPAARPHVCTRSTNEMAQ